MELPQQQEMETLLDLFEHDGWKIFIEEKERLLKSLKENAYAECNTNDEWQQRRGIIVTLNSLVTYADTIKYVMENQEDFNGSENV